MRYRANIGDDIPDIHANDDKTRTWHILFYFRYSHLHQICFKDGCDASTYEALKTFKTLGWIDDNEHAFVIEYIDSHDGVNMCPKCNGTGHKERYYNPCSEIYAPDVNLSFKNNTCDKCCGFGVV